MSGRFLGRAELKSEKGVAWSDAHLGRLEKAGFFPRRVKLAPGTVVWSEEEVDAFLAARVAERDAVAD